MKKTAIIQGSSKNFGNTYKVINYLNKDHLFDVINLKIKNCGRFDDDFDNTDDKIATDPK